MSEETIYFNVEEETRYAVKIKAVKNLAEVGEAFYTREEVQERFDLTYVPEHARRYVNERLVSSQLAQLATQLENGDVRSVVIHDEELLEILKNETVQKYAEGVSRRGNRLVRWKARKRKQVRPRRKDGHILWNAVMHYIRDELGFFGPHIPRRDQSANYLKFLQRAVRWKHVAKYIHTDQRRWCRMIWQKPEEYL